MVLGQHAGRGLLVWAVTRMWELLPPSALRGGGSVAAPSASTDPWGGLWSATQPDAVRPVVDVLVGDTLQVVAGGAVQQRGQPDERLVRVHAGAGAPPLEQLARCRVMGRVGREMRWAAVPALLRCG
jgi:hypothetical protein